MGDNDWYTSNAQVKLNPLDTGSGVAATYYTLDGSQFTYSGPFTITQGLGMHALTWWSVDNAGNVEDRSKVQNNLEVNVDTTLPSIAWSANASPNANGWYNHSVLVRFTPAVGPSGVSLVTPDRTVTSSTGPITGTVTDGAGRTASNATDSFNIDEAPPTINGKASSPPNANGWYNVSVTVNFTALDPVSGVQSTIGNTTLTGEGPGQSVTGTSMDYAGNTNSTTVTGIDIDESAPVVTLAVSPAIAPSGWYVSDAVVNISASDAIAGVDYISYDLDGNGWIRYSSNLTLGDGKHTLQYEAVDKAGNIARYAKAINVDTIKPASTVDLAGTMGTTGWYTSNITVTIVPVVGVSGFGHSEYSFDGVNWTRGSSYAIVTEGGNTSYYRSVDSAGNVEAYKVLVVKVDRSLPTISCMLSGSMGSKGWYTSDVSVTLTTEDTVSGINRTEYSMNGQPWNKYTGTFTIPLGSQLTVYYRTIDNAGNTAGNSTFVYFPPGTFNLMDIIGGLLSRGQPTAMPTATPTAMATTTPTLPMTQTAGSSPSVMPDPAGISTATVERPSGTGYWLWILLLGFAIVVIVGGAYILFFRK